MEQWDEKSISETTVNDLETARMAIRWAVGHIHTLHETKAEAFVCMAITKSHLESAYSLRLGVFAEFLSTVENGSPTLVLRSRKFF